MSFTPNIPQVTQSLGQTQAAVFNNFANYNTVISVDHVAPNALNQGNHNQVTFYQYGSAPYTMGANKSFLYALNASNAGSQLVYQPTVVNPGFAVPVSPRAIARILRVPGPTYSVVGGPYGAGTQFNTAAPTNAANTSFTFNFISNLATADYFVMFSDEGTFPFASAISFISNKTQSGFQVNLQGSAATNVNYSIMVF